MSFSHLEGWWGHVSMHMPGLPLHTFPCCWYLMLQLHFPFVKMSVNGTNGCSPTFPHVQALDGAKVLVAVHLHYSVLGTEDLLGPCASEPLASASNSASMCLKVRAMEQCLSRQRPCSPAMTLTGLPPSPPSFRQKLTIGIWLVVIPHSVHPDRQRHVLIPVYIHAGI